MPERDTAKAIRMAMAKKGIKGVELAKKMKVVPLTVTRWRKDGCDSMTDLEAIALFCDMSLSEMMGLAE